MRNKLYAILFLLCPLAVVVDNVETVMAANVEAVMAANVDNMAVVADATDTTAAVTDPIADLESLLREQPQVQEKIYVHTDNSTYFVGDTLWYKAYVVRADNLQPTDMSKLLYVELLTPDGYLVERQHVVVSGNGHAAGQFVLQDSIYSGYYEIRAYTRWQLNFNVTEKKYTRDDRLKFYGEQACKDFFRNFEGLYSRVVPVYQKPKEAGNYIDRYMVSRPKQRVLKEHARLVVSFYPEGGHLIQGVPCRVAFEIRDHNGQNLDLEGTLSNGQKLTPQHLGKGQFTITPGTSRLTATFTWNDKDYHFSLPKAQEAGATLAYDAEKQAATLKSKGVQPSAYAVLCRGKLIDFQRISAGTQTIPLPSASLPTGINELIIYDSEAQPLASRLFFVNNHDYGLPLDVTLTADSAEVGKRTTLRPYAPVDLSVSAPLADGVPHPGFHTFSIAVRDAQTDDSGYDNGNIMTDMLLSSELKGFIAYPGYYFESDDAKHRSDLDMLMMVQGWRRYKRSDIMRYEPEKTLTFEGCVLKVPNFAHIMELGDVEGVGNPTQSLADQMIAEAERMSSESSLNPTSPNSAAAGQGEEEEVYGIDPDATYEENVEYAENVAYKLGAGNVKKPVLVEAEIVKFSDDGKTTQSAGVVTRTDKYSRFCINIPPFYDKAIFFIKAYDIKDSLKKCMGSLKGSKDMLDETQYPDYFVKRDMFFPIYSQPYSWYQINSPELLFLDEDDDELIPENSSLSGNHTLQTVIVKARRRGRRAIDRSKPAIVRDAYDVYNDVSDYGLSYGVVDMMRMPLAASTFFFGNMGRPNQFNIRARVEGTSFYRNYTPLGSEYDPPRTGTSVLDMLRLNRLKDIRLYTDYEIRTDSGSVLETHVPDVVMDFVPLENDAKRYTYRDRRYVLDGVTYPEAFYCPDYSGALPPEPTDYRRTLYWNPNARPDEDGKFHVRFYNNARETRVTVNAAAMDDDGQMYYR